MIQLNLLPDIKIAYLRAQKIKRLVTFVSLGITAASIAFMIVMSFVVFVWDKKSISDLTGDIKKYSNDLGDTNELNKVLTIQSQLGALKDLHDQKPITSRLKDILNTVVPNEVSLIKVDVDTTAHTLTMTGQASTLERANIFADTLKFAYYTTPNAPDNHVQAFKDVNLQSIDFNGKVASVKVSLTYAEVIFSRLQTPTVALERGKITSRAEIERPNPLFTKAVGK